jgi:ATP-binding cassette subfamily F protein uup
MDKVVDHLLVFKGEGQIEDFPGNYSDYRSYEDSKPHISKKEINDGKSWKEPAKNKLSYNEEKELKNIETKIKTLNYEKKEVEKEFLQEGLSQEKILLMSGELEKIIAEINAKEERWFVLSSKLEE